MFYKCQKDDYLAELHSSDMLTCMKDFIFCLIRGLKDNLAGLFLPSKAISFLASLVTELITSITALLACQTCSQRTSKGHFNALTVFIQLVYSTLCLCFCSTA